MRWTSQSEVRRAGRVPRSAMALALLLSMAPGVRGQSAAEKVVIEKARSLEIHGHADLAAQAWQQVLLSDPNNTEAIAGLARAAKQRGNDAQAKAYIERLRQINPSDPNIAKAESVLSDSTRNARLAQASKLAQAGQTEAALNIYRAVFGARPPDGDWALAYYDTEASSPAGRADAIGGLRDLARRNPSDARYAITLGRILSYTAGTRAEGERILRSYSQDAAAQQALRQALVWDSENPSAAAAIRDYLKQHNDAELAQRLRQTEEKQSHSGIAINPEERAAYSALQAGRVDDAQTRFLALNAKEPDNPRVLAGLGFLRMKQGDFAGAIRYLEVAQRNGSKEPSVASGLATSQFWLTMQEGTTALNEGRSADAIEKYRAALVLRPNSPEALDGLSGALMKQGNFADAAATYERTIQATPDSSAAWRGLFMARQQGGSATAAIEAAKRSPAAVRAQLSRDPDYLRALAAAYTAAGQEAEADAVLAQALDLPFPQNGRGLKTATRLQYAGLLAQGKRIDQAIGLYRDILRDDPASIAAWQGLVNVLHQDARDAEAVAVVERMPPASYDEALHDVDFLSSLAAVYQTQNQLDVAQSFLERAAKLESRQGREPAVPLQLQLAAMELQRNLTDQAYADYRRILASHPERVDGWKGLISALHQTGHDREALAQIEEIPAAVARRLNDDLEYEQTLAAIYASTGNSQAALAEFDLVRSRYSERNVPPPAEVDIQGAWLLYNSGDDRGLYAALMRLGARSGLSDAQRRQIQAIWASWSTRLAGQAADAGNRHRSLEILNAAAEAFPGNPAVSRSLAGGYLKAGEPRIAVEIYKSLDLSSASAADYQGAIGAALAANNLQQAELWLREALEQFPNEAQILAAAARFEHARGDNRRAAAYWRASVAAMPKVSPANQLAHDLSVPDQASRGGEPGRTRVNDLASLLNPDADAPARHTEAISLPGSQYAPPAGGNGDQSELQVPYGPDPYDGGAPVVLGRSTPQRVTAERVAGTGVSDLDEPPDVGPALSLGKQSRAGSKHRPALATGNGLLPEENTNATGNSTEGATERLGDYRPQSSLGVPPEIRSDAFQTNDPPSNLSASVEQNIDDEAARAYAAQQETSLNVEASPAPRRARITSVPAPDPAPISEFAEAGAAPAENNPENYSAVQNLPNSTTALSNAAIALSAAGRTVDPPPAGTYHAVQYGDTPVAQVSPYEAQNASSGPTPVSQNASQSGATDDQLQQRNLPPLRGAYGHFQQTARPVDPRQEALRQIASIEGGSSPWMGGTGVVSHRSGTAGYDRLTTLEAPFELSSPLGPDARLTVVSRTSFLDSGLADGTSVNMLGTLPVGSTTLPPQQNATGIGGELQLATAKFSGSVGYTPYGFLISNIIGRAAWRPAGGPITVNFTRDAIKDTQLSYSGLRDPGSTGPTYAGNIWGGVISDAGSIQFTRGGELSGYYGGAGAQELDGYHVQSNFRVDGSAGAYWRMLTLPGVGSLTLGANFFGMHYAHNVRYFTYGQGGYFSPDVYFLGSVPVGWTGHYGPNFHYNVTGSLGAQAFQEDSSPYFPLDIALQATFNNQYYPARSSVGGNYDFHGEAAYRMDDHWYAGGFLSANNSRDYNSTTAGFFVRYMIRPQYPTELGPTGLFPYDGLRPLMVP